MGNHDHDHPQDHNNGGHSGEASHGHHILSENLAWKIWGALMVLTVITVWIADFHFGAWNFIIAMLVATIKATLVAAFFMGLKYDKKINVVIFITSVIFVGIFMALTFSDLFYRNRYTVRPIAMKSSGKFSKPWVSSPELVSHGKELFTQQCVTCHGAEGKGNGPAAAAMNPPPRNFTAADGWKNGHKPSRIYGTLTKGLNSMPSFASLSEEDRWALAQYVVTFHSPADVDTDADIKAAGFDPSTPLSVGGGDKTLPIDVAIDLMAVDKKK